MLLHVMYADVAQWQSASLPRWLLWVQVPSSALIKDPYLATIPVCKRLTEPGNSVFSKGFEK